MAEHQYLDFDLHIERVGQGYRAEANSLAGQSASTFAMPFSDLEIENLVLKLGHTGRGMRRIDSPEVAAAKTFGARLFDTVFADDLRACLRSSFDEADRQGAGLRIRLHLTDAPELADLPWEYLYYTASNRFLALSAATPLVRYLELSERIRPLAVIPPLRMLVMIASPRSVPPLDTEREWTKLQAALGGLSDRGLVTLERIPATLAALQQQLRRNAYHILHFIGHGGFDERTQDGVLLFEDEERESDRVSGQDLGTLLHDHRSLRFVMLNACEGARGSRTDPFAGITQSLVQQGLPAVIAMQFEVSDDAAIGLAREFYSAVADRYPIDAALAEARKALFAAGNRIEWGTPVLYLRAPDGKIFDVGSAAESSAPAPLDVAVPVPPHVAPEVDSPTSPPPIVVSDIANDYSQTFSPVSSPLSEPARQTEQELKSSRSDAAQHILTDMPIHPYLRARKQASQGDGANVVETLSDVQEAAHTKSVVETLAPTLAQTHQQSSRPSFLTVWLAIAVLELLFGVFIIDRLTWLVQAYMFLVALWVALHVLQTISLRQIWPVALASGIIVSMGGFAEKEFFYIRLLFFAVASLFPLFVSFGRPGKSINSGHSNVPTSTHSNQQIASTQRTPSEQFWMVWFLGTFVFGVLPGFMCSITLGDSGPLPLVAFFGICLAAQWIALRLFVPFFHKNRWWWIIVSIFLTAVAAPLAGATREGAVISIVFFVLCLLLCAPIITWLRRPRSVG